LLLVAVGADFAAVIVTLSLLPPLVVVAGCDHCESPALVVVVALIIHHLDVIVTIVVNSLAR